MTAYHIIAGDSHFVEPANLWAERIDPKCRDRHTCLYNINQQGRK